MLEINKVHCGDSFELIKDMPNKCGNVMKFEGFHIVEDTQQEKVEISIERQPVPSRSEDSVDMTKKQGTPVESYSPTEQEVSNIPELDSHETAPADNIKLARQCMDFINLKCKNKHCINEYCPLNKIYDKKEMSNKILPNNIMCKCGHHKSNHEIAKDGRCIYGLTIGEKGIINEGCNCKRFEEESKTYYKATVINDNLTVDSTNTLPKGCGKYETRGAYTFTCGESSRAGKIQLCKECRKENRIKQCSHPIGERDIDGQCNSCGKMIIDEDSTDNRGIAKSDGGKA